MAYPVLLNNNQVTVVLEGEEDKERDIITMRRFTAWDTRVRASLRANKAVKLVYDVWSYPHVPHLLGRELKNGGKILDLGCGTRSIFTCVNKAGKRFFSVGVDICETRLSQSKQAGIHDTWIKGDINTIEFAPKSFDIVLYVTH